MRLVSGLGNVHSLQKIAKDGTRLWAPVEYRSDTVPNLEEWYKAYNIKPGDKLYVNPEDRAEIW